MAFRGRIANPASDGTESTTFFAKKPPLMCCLRFAPLFITPPLRVCVIVWCSCWPPAAQITDEKHPKSSNFQSKTLTAKNKNINFQKFLSPFIKKSYEQQAQKNSKIFDSYVHIALIIEGRLFSPHPIWNLRYEIPNNQYAIRSPLYARYPTNYNIFPDTLFYAKQTQSQVGQNERKLFYNR